MAVRYFIRLAFKGTNYHGWQIQANAATIQETINKALSTILREEIHVVGAGRTDTGVHASCFYAHFDVRANIIYERENIIFRLNRFLPDDIAIYDLFPVKEKAHARYDAISRTYQYQITAIKDPFRRESAYYCFWKLNVEKMNQACHFLFDYKDFTSFSKSQTQVKTNFCEIYQAEWTKEKHLLIFTVKANRFLRNMVRAIVGTMLEIGQEKIEPEQIKEIIESKDRSNAGYSVPPNGLFLTNIEYPDDILSEQ
ncbi:MAG: tRNA pseudouridine(38-40) synthase TruA [Bacteroidales bacterium]